MQCLLCEDWFHNHHLLPPILKKAIEDEYMLICRGCVGSLTAQRITAYIDYMEPTCQKTFTKLFALDLDDPRLKFETTS